MHGVLVVDKPPGPTSAEIVRIVKRRLGTKTGHLGTLDPFASGVLPLCLGEATKVAQLLAEADKEYVGTVQLGARTDTGDPTGRVVEERALPSDLEEGLSLVAQRLSGRRLQTPPMFSAIKRGGVPLYKLARQGVFVEREAREVEVEFLEVQRREQGQVWFHVRCSKGTYVRVLAEEIAEVLGTVGYLLELRRVRFGPFDLSQAVSLETIQGCGDPLPILPTRQALAHLRAFPVPAPIEQRVRQGALDVLARLPEGKWGEHALLVGQGENVIALLCYGARGWQYVRVLHEPSVRPTEQR
ncbi:MAG: tRNA pseudouridine synthase B [Candidatus Binatia bacterium]|nr:MAG: tRNA pseudouridine synthase B [Candidatus Binatia bacterium]